MKTRFLSLKSFYIKLFLLTASLSVAVSCNRDDEQVVDNSITADLSSISLADGQDTAGGKIWKDTYTADKPLEIGIFKFNHNAYPDWNTWYGFTLSNSRDNADHINSEGGWVANQWGTMAKGGVNGEGAPFLVSYADHLPSANFAKTIKEGEVINVARFSSSVEITDDTKTYAAKSASFAISPWPYYGIKNGDSFARKFDKGDFFAIHIFGLDKDKKTTNNAKPVTHYFVDFRNGINTIDTSWKNVNLSALGNVKYLVFFLETTDMSGEYANTSLYFTMDKLKVEEVKEKEKDKYLFID